MKPQSPSAPDNKMSGTPARKPYSTPHLQQYGDLAEITKGNSGTMSNDGSAHANKHFTS